MTSVGVHIYICILYMFVDQKNLNHTLATDSLFQTFAVGLLVEFIDLLYHCFLQKGSTTAFSRKALPLLSPETLSSSSKSRIFLYNVNG